MNRPPTRHPICLWVSALGEARCCLFWYKRERKKKSESLTRNQPLNLQILHGHSDFLLSHFRDETNTSFLYSITELRKYLLSYYIILQKVNASFKNNSKAVLSGSVNVAEADGVKMSLILKKCFLESPKARFHTISPQKICNFYFHHKIGFYVLVRPDLLCNGQC